MIRASASNVTNYETAVPFDVPRRVAYTRLAASGRVMQFDTACGRGYNDADVEGRRRGNGSAGPAGPRGHAPVAPSGRVMT